MRLAILFCTVACLGAFTASEMHGFVKKEWWPHDVLHGIRGFTHRTSSQCGIFCRRLRSIFMGMLAKDAKF